jgi:malate dehydrogenase
MARRKIAVVGGGQIGGIIAMIVAQKELGNLVLLDIADKEDFIKGKALDIMQMRPNDGVDTELTGNSDFSAMEGADVVLVTAGVPRKPGMTRDDLLNVNLSITRNVAQAVKQHAPDAFVVITTNPLDAMVYAFHKISGLPRNQIVGMAGALDTARFRTFIAMEAGLSVRDVSCLVMGGHGPSMVPLVRTATVGGVPLTELLPAERIEAIVQRTRDAGTELVKLYGNGSAYFSTASAVVEMAEAYLKDKKRVIPTAALCQGEYGVDGLFIGVPAVIGSGGMERVLEFELTAEERAMLDATVEAVAKTTQETGV